MTGTSLIGWIIRAFIAVCVFILARFLIVLLFGLVHVTLPDEVVVVLALLIAIGLFWYWPWRPAAPPAP